MFGVDFVDLFTSLVFLDYISPFNIYCKAVWWYWNLLTFVYLKSFLFLHQFWMRSLPGTAILIVDFFSPFSTLNISCHSLLACRVSAERSAVKHMRFPLYITCFFSLAAFNILSLCLIFVSLISMCLGVFLFGFILYGALCASWTWLTISFPVLGKFSTIKYLKIFLYPLFFLFFFCDPYNSNVSASDIIPEVSKTILSSFHSFLLYSAFRKLFPPF